MRSHLKVKVYTLAAEMKYIHRQEIKWKQKAKAARLREKQHADEKAAGAIAYCEKNFWTNRWHRQDLKSEARTNHLAYGFLRGRSYQQMEYISYGGIKGFNREAPDWTNIEATIIRFIKDEPKQQEIMQKFAEWIEAAKLWFDGNPERIRVTKDMRKSIALALANDPRYQAEKAERAAQAKAAQAA